MMRGKQRYTLQSGLWSKALVELDVNTEVDSERSAVLVVLAMPVGLGARVVSGE